MSSPGSLTINIVGYAQRKDLTTGQTYIIYDIECKSENKEWHIQKRYSELLELHHKILSIYGDIDLLKFPQKLLVGNFSKQMLEKRKDKLQAYLVDLVTRDNIPEAVMFFKSGTAYRNSWKVGDLSLQRSE
jgi:hypothetical protein